MSKDDWCQKITQKHWCCKNHEETRIETRYARLLYPFGHEELKKGRKLVGGFKHFLFSIIYMGCHPSHWLSYFSRWLLHTNQFRYIPLMAIPSHLPILEKIWWTNHMVKIIFHPPIFCPWVNRPVSLEILVFRPKKWWKHVGFQVDCNLPVKFGAQIGAGCASQISGFRVFHVGLRQNLLPSGND